MLAADDAERALRATAAALNVPAATAAVASDSPLRRLLLDVCDGVALDAAEVAEQLPTALALDSTAAAAVQAAALITLLWDAHDAAVRAAAALEEHIAFWCERVEAAERVGPIWAAITDAAEAGPIEWLTAWPGRRRRLRGGAAGEPRGHQPVDKAAGLFALRFALLQCIGGAARCLATFAAAASPADVCRALVAAAAFLQAALHLPPEELEAAAAASNVASATSPAGTQPRGGRRRSAAQAWAPPFRCEALHGFAVRARAQIIALDRIIARRAAPLRARPAWQRYWLRWLILGGATIAGVRYLASNAASMRDWFSGAMRSVQTFYVEHLAGPLAHMAEELLDSSHGAAIAKRRAETAAEIADARTTMRSLLKNYYGRLARHPATWASLSPELRAAGWRTLADNVDMRALSERFVLEVQRPLVNAVGGDLVEILLIQVAAIKAEVVEALAAMDEVLDDNRFNFQVSAMLPAGMVLYATARAVQWLAAVATAPIDTTNTRLAMRLLLHDVYRLLSLASGAVEADTRGRQLRWRLSDGDEPRGLLHRRAATAAAASGGSANSTAPGDSAGGDAAMLAAGELDAAPLASRRAPGGRGGLLQGADEAACLTRASAALIADVAPLWSDEALYEDAGAWYDAALGKVDAQTVRPQRDGNGAGDGDSDGEERDASPFGAGATTPPPITHIRSGSTGSTGSDRHHHDLTVLREEGLRFTAPYWYRTPLGRLIRRTVTGAVVGGTWLAGWLAARGGTATAPAPADNVAESPQARPREPLPAGATVDALLTSRLLRPVVSLSASVGSASGTPVGASNRAGGNAGGEPSRCSIVALPRPANLSQLPLPRPHHHLSAVLTPTARGSAGDAVGGEGPSDEGSGHGSDGAAAATLYPGLAPHQLGYLLVLLHRLNGLLCGYRRSIPFAEWSRVTADLRDLVSSRLSHTQRLDTVKRILNTYTFLAVAEVRGGGGGGGGASAALSAVL